jgi:transposase
VRGTSTCRIGHDDVSSLQGAQSPRRFVLLRCVLSNSLETRARRFVVITSPKYTVDEFLLTYMSWMSMIQRAVHNARSRRDFEFYRGRGISVCRRWRKFDNFVADMGPRPAKRFTLDRFPNKNGNYTPGNCRWATAKQQSANTRSARLITFEGETHPISEWERRRGLSRGVLRARLKAKRSVSEAITTPSHECIRKSFATGLARGKKLTAAQVRQIVTAASGGKTTAAALGRKFGVSAAGVIHVLKQFGVRMKKGRPKKC